MHAGRPKTDPNSMGIVFFGDETFATSRALFSAPAVFESIRDGDSSSWSSSTWTDLMGPQTSATITTDDGNSRMLYRIDNDGSSHLLHDLGRSTDVPYRFGSNVYVQDQGATDPDITSISRIPVDGSAPQRTLDSVSSAP